MVTLDEMSLYYQATLTRVWSPIGVTPVIRITPQREMIHFYGALDVRNRREIAVTAPEQTSAVTADFVRILLLLFPTQHILLLLDRAPWHHGDDLSQVLAENQRLAVMYFPVACPELNPQEHICSQARDAISHNHPAPSFDSLIDDFDAFLNETCFETNFMEKYGPPNYAMFN